MPARFEPLTRDPRLQPADTFMATAAFWSEGGQRWHTGSAIPPAGESDPDGAEELFELILDDSPQAFARFARDFLEIRRRSDQRRLPVRATRPRDRRRAQPRRRV